MIQLRSLSAACFLLASVGSTWTGAATLEQIPSPRPMGWVTDLTGTLPLQTVTELNRVGDRVQAETGAEMAVVVIGSTDGAPPRDLASRLLTSWEIGDPRKGNGLLLLVAVNDGTTEIALGEGIRDAAKLSDSQSVLRTEMAPRIRRGDPAGAILHGAAACARRLLGVQVTVAMPAAEPSSASTADLPAADDPLPSTAVPDAQADAPASTTPGTKGGYGPLLGICLLCGGLLAAWGIALKLLHSPPHHHRRRKVKLARLNPAVSDATGSW
ncbi:MAG TPA: TPM domain-containing protein [Thermoanaerobaculia bacterium]|nr:TPM domain-containing protein [Thermoanaerobaculia bacterium]